MARGESAPEKLAYRARALAQAHPLSALARRYIDQVTAAEKASQPSGEVAFWASVALLNGYCVRRVEETDTTGEAELDTAIDLDDLDAKVAKVAADLRAGQTAGLLLADEDSVIEALDRIVASEVDKRLDQVLEVDDKEAARSELSEYLAWFVVRGYALRVAEARTGEAVPVPGQPGEAES